MFVLLDKSYLQGSSGQVIQDLCNRNNVLMPPALFYELLTTKPEVRAACFRKFPQRDNPVGLVPNIGVLLRYEIENKCECAPINKVLEGIVYVFNDGLRDEGYQLDKMYQDALEDIAKDHRQHIHFFKQSIGLSFQWFPELNDMRLLQNWILWSLRGA